MLRQKITLFWLTVIHSMIQSVVIYEGKNPKLYTIRVFREWFAITVVYHRTEQGLAPVPKYIMNLFLEFSKGIFDFLGLYRISKWPLFEIIITNQYCMMMFYYNLQRTTVSARGDRLRFVCAAVDICLQFDWITLRNSEVFPCFPQHR